MRSVELFAGCGGLALGLARAGFEHELVVELDPHAIATLTENKRRKIKYVSEWRIEHKDVRSVDFSRITKDIDVLAGGPPCQPFSIGGMHVGPDDERNMWPEAIRAVRELLPKAFLFENVRGLLRPAFAAYLSYLKLHLAFPELAARSSESWVTHLARLKRHHSKWPNHASYKVVFGAVNTADYGAPQQRQRALVIGVRADVAVDWEFPNPSHSRCALMWSKYVSGSYWLRHGDRAEAHVGSSADLNLLSELLEGRTEPSGKAWMTVRDAVGDLPGPLEAVELIPNHRLRPGARRYPGHTGSQWDWPAKALKAGDHGVPGGENMLALEDGTVRYFTLREMARLQGFPDDFVFENTWKRPIKQLGNAVPIQVGESFGRKLVEIVASTSRDQVLFAA